jgi:hypothetical protein
LRTKFVAGLQLKRCSESKEWVPARKITRLSNFRAFSGVNEDVPLGMFNQPRVNWQPFRPVPVEQHSQSAARTTTGLGGTQAGITGLNRTHLDHDYELSVLRLKSLQISERAMSHTAKTLPLPAQFSAHAESSKMARRARKLRRIEHPFKLEEQRAARFRERDGTKDPLPGIKNAVSVRVDFGGWIKMRLSNFQAETSACLSFAGGSKLPGVNCRIRG